MAELMELPREKWFDYFRDLTARYLAAEAVPPGSLPSVVAPDLYSEHKKSRCSRVTSLIFDPRADLLEITLDGGVHRIHRPREIWVDETPDGFVRSIDVLRTDDVRELIRLEFAERQTLRR